MSKYLNITPRGETRNFFGKNLRRDLTEFLHNEIIEVMFEKVDGTERKMLCTLQSNVINQDYESYDDTNPPKIINEEVMRVFDTEASSWRSFRLANLKYVKTDLKELPKEIKQRARAIDGFGE